MNIFKKLYFYKKFKHITHIDIGCGNFKEEGYFGIDIYPGRDVDLVMDLNKGELPFEDNQIEHVVSYHCIEHIENYIVLMNEIWRIMKPNAQFFLSVPYYNNYINFANIFHKHHFNEHSMRFFSSEKETKCLPEYIWKYKFAPTWGLKGSANSKIKAEFRCLKIEIDYFPQYKLLTEEEKIEARLNKPNVAHNICYYLQCIKPENEIIEIQEDEIIVPKRRLKMIEAGW